jgi:hypothetical protein
MTRNEEAESWLQVSTQVIINAELRRFERMLQFVTYVEKVIVPKTLGKLTTLLRETLHRR